MFLLADYFQCRTLLCLCKCPFYFSSTPVFPWCAQFCDTVLKTATKEENQFCKNIFYTHTQGTRLGKVSKALWNSVLYTAWLRRQLWCDDCSKWIIPHQPRMTWHQGYYRSKPPKNIHATLLTASDSSCPMSGQDLTYDPPGPMGWKAREPPVPACKLLVFHRLWEIENESALSSCEGK